MPVPLLSRGRAQQGTNTTIVSSITATTGSPTTVTASAAVGDVLFCAYASKGFGATDTYSMIDSVGNTWTQAGVSLDTSTGQAVNLFYSVLTVPLVSGSSKVGVTNSAGSQSNDIVIVWKVAHPGWTLPIATDGTAGAVNHTSVSSAVTCGSVTPTNTPDYAVMLSGSQPAETGTPPAGWTEIFDVSSLSNGLQVNQLVNNSKVAVAPTETLAGNAQWVGLQVHFKMTIQATPIRGSQGMNMAILKASS